jgi:homoserine O-acetyltransferase
VPRIQASALCVGIEEDQLFPAKHMEGLARSLRELGRHAEYAAISSPYGHDGFLIEWEPLDALLRRAIALPPGGRTGAVAASEEPRTEVNLLRLGPRLSRGLCESWAYADGGGRDAPARHR